MKNIYINGVLIATIHTENPHGSLRDKLDAAQMSGKTVEIVEG